ncbi:MAG: DNA polymerase III subunit delta [Oscillospiraceae bacterium]|jgi:DNA polymerase-3 subunit delta|nr:DNA polymerase III subunit delta [Oscillospiraceae bacterium]
MILTAENLSKQLRQNAPNRLYFLYGKEVFLTETYADKILDKCLNEEERGFNLIKFTGNPDLSRLCEAIEVLPVFAEKRVVVINDPDPEKLDGDSLSGFIGALSDIPETTVVIIRITGFSVDAKKAKTKKLLACAEKRGAVCEFGRLSEAKTAELIIKRAKRAGCEISRSNAAYLARLALCDLTLISRETDKLCAYAGYGGEITSGAIDLLSVKQLDAGVFALAAQITNRNGSGALRLLDELIALGTPPVMIMSALSTAFIDFYRAKLGAVSAAGKRAEEIAADFNYPKNRAWAVGKAMGAVGRVGLDKLRQCLKILADTDYKLKSSPVGDRILMEKAVAELLLRC